MLIRNSLIRIIFALYKQTLAFTKKTLCAIKLVVPTLLNFPTTRSKMTTKSLWAAENSVTVELQVAKSCKLFHCTHVPSTNGSAPGRRCNWAFLGAVGLCVICSVDWIWSNHLLTYFLTHLFIPARVGHSANKRITQYLSRLGSDYDRSVSRQTLRHRRT